MHTRVDCMAYSEQRPAASAMSMTLRCYGQMYIYILIMIRTGKIQYCHAIANFPMSADVQAQSWFISRTLMHSCCLRVVHPGVILGLRVMLNGHHY